MSKPRCDIRPEGSQEILRMEGLPMPLLPISRREAAGDGSAGRFTQAAAGARRRSAVLGEQVADGHRESLLRQGEIRRVDRHGLRQEGEKLSEASFAFHADEYQRDAGFLRTERHTRFTRYA